MSDVLLLTLGFFPVSGWTYCNMGDRTIHCVPPVSERDMGRYHVNSSVMAVGGRCGRYWVRSAPERYMRYYDIALDGAGFTKRSIEVPFSQRAVVHVPEGIVNNGPALQIYDYQLLPLLAHFHDQASDFHRVLRMHPA